MGKRSAKRGITAGVAVAALALPLLLTSSSAGAAGNTNHCTARATSSNGNFQNCQFNAVGSTVTYTFSAPNGQADVQGYATSNCTGPYYYSDVVFNGKKSGSFTATPGDCINVVAEGNRSRATAKG